MIQCNRCNLQYIGETKRGLKDRFNEHRCTIDKINLNALSILAIDTIGLSIGAGVDRCSNLEATQLLTVVLTRFSGYFSRTLRTD